MNKKTYIPIIAVLLIALIIGFFAGYRVDGFSITQVPTLSITIPHEGSTIFVDKKEYKTTRNDNQIVTIKQSTQGTRNFIVSHPDRWPWTKNISLRNGNDYSLTAFNALQTPVFEIITQENTEYGSLVAEINATKLPSSDSQISSGDTKMSLYVDNDTIFATWNGTAQEAPSLFCDNNECVRTIKLASFITPIRNLALYPGSNDLMIISVDIP